MAFLPGIFSQKPATPAPVATPPAAGPASLQQQPANPQAAPANMTGAMPQPANPGGPQPAPASGLDAFTKLFQPQPVDPKAPKQLTMADPILGALDPAAFKQQIANANFASNVPQTQLQAALSGDTAAFQDVLNAVSREAFAAAAQLSHGLVENGVRTGAERLNGSLDSRFRDLSLRSQTTSNEQLNHPAVAPMLQGVKMMIAQSNPNLSPTEVQSQAEQYFTQMASALTAPKAGQTPDQNAPVKGDFSYLLN